MIKIRVGINELESRKSIKKMNENTKWFFYKVKKIDSTLAWLIKKKQKSKRKEINYQLSEIKGKISLQRL